MVAEVVGQVSVARLGTPRTGVERPRRPDLSTVQDHARHVLKVGLVLMRLLKHPGSV